MLQLPADSASMKSASVSSIKQDSMLCLASPYSLVCQDRILRQLSDPLHFFSSSDHGLALPVVTKRCLIHFVFFLFIIGS